MGNLAILYRNQGRYAEAEPLNLAAFEGRRRVLGDRHPDTLDSMNNLAWLRLIREPEASRDPRSALELALEVAEKTGYENPDYLDTLSLAYHLTGDSMKAVENQRRAIALLPDGSPARASFDEALAKFEAALD